MSARENLIDFVSTLVDGLETGVACDPQTGHAVDPVGYVEKMLNQHAHELAEKIRAKRRDEAGHNMCKVCLAYSAAARLIDPEV